MGEKTASTPFPDHRRPDGLPTSVLRSPAEQRIDPFGSTIACAAHRDCSATRGEMLATKSTPRRSAPSSLAVTYLCAASSAPPLASWRIQTSCPVRKRKPARWARNPKSQSSNPQGGKRSLNLPVSPMVGRDTRTQKEERESCSSPLGHLSPSDLE